MYEHAVRPFSEWCTREILVFPNAREARRPRSAQSSLKSSGATICVPAAQVAEFNRCCGASSAVTHKEMLGAVFVGPPPLRQGPP